MENFVIGCMIGPLRFTTDFEKYGQLLSLERVIVLRPECFYAYTGQTFSDEERIMLNSMTRAKIDMAEFVFVINSGGYTGTDTQDEILYAISQNKPLLFSYPLSGSNEETIREIIRQNWGTAYITIEKGSGIAGFLPSDISGSLSNFLQTVVNNLQ